MPFPCTVCNKIFKGKRDLDIHNNAKRPCTGRHINEKITNEYALIESKKKYNDKFNYDKFIYVDAKTKVILYCNFHKQEFFTLFNNHMVTKNGGCQLCAKNTCLNYEEYLCECKKLNFSNLIYDDETQKMYKNFTSNIKIKCKIHDYFEINSKNHIKNFRHCPKCELNELTKVDTKLLEMLKKTPDIKYTHLEETEYSCDQYGNIYKNNIMLNKTYKDGYAKFHIKGKRVYSHIFIYECFYQTIVNSAEYDVDHIDPTNKSNNILNLQILNKNDHMKKTALQNPDKGLAAGKKMSKKTIRILLDSDNLEIDRKIYNSIREAAKDNNIRPSNINRYISTNGRIKCKNYHWIIEELNDIIAIDNEVWKILEKYPTIEISNKGRIKLKSKRITYGKELNGYMKYNSTFIHTLVALAFIGEKPKWASSVNHIDKNTKNNCIENLEWSTPKLQMLHAIGIKIESYNLKTNIVYETFESIADAKEKYSFDPIVVNFTHKGIKSIDLDVNISFRRINMSSKLQRRREEFRFKYYLQVLKDKNTKSLLTRKLPYQVYKIKRNGVNTYEYKKVDDTNLKTYLIKKNYSVYLDDKSPLDRITEFRKQWESTNLIKQYWLIHRYYPLK